MKITGDYFLKEYHAFREIMCSRKYTVEQKDKAFSGLTYVYFNIDPNDPKLETCRSAYEALFHEFSMRQVYQITSSLYKSDE